MSVLTSQNPRVLATRPLFSEWNERGVRWALVRGIEDTGEVRGDIDIIVDAADMSLASAIAKALGYSEMSAYGRATHRFFLNYSADERTWT